MPIHHFHSLPAEPAVDYDRAINLADALERSLSSLSLARLEAAALPVAQVPAPRGLTGAFDAAQAESLPKTLVQHCKKLNDPDLGLEEKLIVLHEIEQPKMNALATAGLIDARDVVLSAAFSGGINDLRAAWQAMQPLIADENRQDVLDRALSLCAYGQTLEDDSANNIDTAKSAYLVAEGANVQSLGIWQDMLDSEDGEADLYALFISAGADFSRFREMVETTDCSERFILDIVKALIGTPVYARIDDNTLMQVQFLRPADFHHRIETLYRFDLGRIIENEFDNNGKRGYSHAMHFKDVPVETLTALEDKLRSLGGNPLSVAHALDGGLRVSLHKPLVKAATP